MHGDKKLHIYDDELIENMKKYYQLEDHNELLKFIKRYGVTTEDIDLILDDD